MKVSKLIPQQFSWQQTNEEVTIIFNDKYFEFCWHASCSMGEFPPINKKDLKVIISKSSTTIQLTQFKVNAFEGIF